MQTLLHSVPPTWQQATANAHLCWRLLDIHRESGSVSCGVTAPSPGSWCAQGSVCALQNSISPVLCKFWWLSGGLTGDLLQEGLCHTQVYCTQSPCPCSSPLLTHTSSGDIQIQFCLSLCGVSRSWYAQGMFEPSGFILNVILPHHHLGGASPLALDVRYLFKVAPE